MNSIITLSTTLWLLVSLGACGKKPEVNNNSAKEKLRAPTEGELYFNAFLDIKKAINNNDLPLLKKTIQDNPGLDLNQILDDGDTFLIMAIKKEFRNIRNYLIEKGANVEKVNVNKESPLIVATLKGSLNSVKILLDLKVDLEKKDANGDAALHLAIKQNNDEVASLLIKQGASIESTDNKLKNAYKLAKEHNVPNTLVLLETILKVEIGAPDTTAFISILNKADLNRLQQVVNQYPNIVKDYEELNPLAVLVTAKDRFKALKSAELLISKSANINGPKTAEQTPLVKATVSQKEEFASLYLNSNANPQIQDKDGKSALIHAIELNNLSLVDLLLSHSAAESYTFRRNGKRITFNACTSARSIEAKLTTSEAKEENRKIKSSLNCGFSRFF